MVHALWPMVYRVCRATIGDFHEAEDAFQATFLVLVKEARRLKVRDSLGPWLYQVALRVSLFARNARRRRRLHEQEAGIDASRTSMAGTDVHAVIDQTKSPASCHAEISRLPAPSGIVLSSATSRDCLTLKLPVSSTYRPGLSRAD